MNKLYSLLLVGACVGHQAAHAQQWRPFRANQDVHAFRGASADTVFTMRLDSAGVQGIDSVYYFNRTLRSVNNSNSQWQKSLNNKLGKLMRYDRATRTYSLYWDGGPTMGNTADQLLVLKPFARVGETWSSYFTDYGVQTTLLSRGTSVIDGVTDSIATFGFRTGVTVVLSKNYGLVSAPVDLKFGIPSTKMLTLARRPAPAGQSYYNPLDLLNLQPGNELGYYQDPALLGPYACANVWLLRRVLSRQVTADSVVYRFQQQKQTVYNTTPNCSGNSNVVGPVEVVRMAASLRTGRWAGPNNPNVTLMPVNTDLLAGEYRTLPGTPPSLMMGYPVVTTRGTTACSTPVLLQQQMLYRISGSTYNPYQAIDLPGWQQQVSPGVGLVSQAQERLVYFVRTVNGVDQVCGNRSGFGTLLPTKAAQAAALMALYPNPAAELVTLRLAQASGAATTVRLLDKLGRCVLVRNLAAGQQELSLPLHEVATGLYVVEVQSRNAGVQHLKLEHTR